MPTQPLSATHADLPPGTRVEVVHRIQLGTRVTESRTVGTLVGHESREIGLESGYRRWWDERQAVRHWVLRKGDGELTAITLDDFTEIRRLE